MITEKELKVLYYCNHCRKDVESSIGVWISGIVPIVRKIEIVVEARCPECGIIIGTGEGVVELH